MKNKNLLFFYPSLFTFIQTEIKLLSSDYEIICRNQNWTNKYLLPFNLIVQFFFLIYNIRKVDVILISFGGYHSFFPALLGKLFGKKVVIIVHGTDCVNFPEINYGSLRIPLMRYFTRKSYQWASVILPVSESLVFTENFYYSNKVMKFGYAHHLQNINTPYKVIPNGLILEDWKMNHEVTKVKNTFITVMTEDQIKRKGGELIVEVANKLSSCTFYFAGIKQIENSPNNVICLGRLSPESLKEWYSKTQFYLQLSNFEGFGVAICEAMLCKCVPIVSNVNFLPVIVGNTGFILKKRNVNLLFELIHTAIESDLTKLGEAAKNRIETKFPVSKRKEMLISTLKSK